MIGRADICQIIIPDKRISRLHAIIEREGENYILRDSNSVNGTYVNGQRIRMPTVLSHQDEIGFSEEERLLRFERS